MMADVDDECMLMTITIDDDDSWCWWRNIYNWWRTRRFFDL